MTLAALGLAGCGPGETGSETESTDGTGTTAGESTVGASTTANSTDGATSGGGECVADDLAECPVTQCSQSWDYSCGECESIIENFDRRACFAYDAGCLYPELNCGLEQPCSRVWAYGLSGLEEFEDEANALCFLNSLRDGVAGEYEVLWGEMGDQGNMEMKVYVDGQGGATVRWVLDCSGCPSSGHVGRSGLLELQPTEYFDTCLEAPTTETLIDCIYGSAEYSNGSTPPVGFTPAWTTGTCSALEFSCPS